jgi:hypothetical protein
MKLPFRNNPIGITTAQGRTAFIPDGKYIISGTRKNPLTIGNVIKNTWAGRLIVGLSVHKVPKYRIEDLIRETRVFLKKSGLPEDASFVAQHGVFTHKDGTIVQEKSAQVFIINAGYYSSTGDWKEFLERLAEFLIIKLEQEVIVVEIQNNGLVDVTWLVVSKKRLAADQREARKKGEKPPQALNIKQIRKT